MLVGGGLCTRCQAGLSVDWIVELLSDYHWKIGSQGPALMSVF